VAQTLALPLPHSYFKEGIGCPRKNGLITVSYSPWPVEKRTIPFNGLTNLRDFEACQYDA